MSVVGLFLICARYRFLTTDCVNKTCGLELKTG